MPGYCPMYGIEQGLVIEGFLQVPDGSGFLGALPGGRIVECGDEDDRGGLGASGELRLELKAAHPAQVDVEDYTVRMFRGPVLEELLSRGEIIG
jgi:hypothetical protein